MSKWVYGIFKNECFEESVFITNRSFGYFTKHKRYTGAGVHINNIGRSWFFVVHQELTEW